MIFHSFYNPSPDSVGSSLYTREPFLYSHEQILKRLRRKILRLFVSVAPISVRGSG